MTIIYGIKNCDTVKKARKWLDKAEVDYQYVDFREQGINRPQVTHWVHTLGWETLVNKRSTSWKQLDQTARETMDETAAIEAIMVQPTLIKRPLLEHRGALSVGFKDADYQNIF